MSQMTPIHVHNLAAPTEGRRRFEHSPITFGRDVANDVMLPAKHASRRHGELRFESGQWWLVNQSPNGTMVNGRQVTRQPRALTDRDVVSIGDQPVFEVRLDSQPAAALAGDAPSPAAAPAKRRTKLWIGMGAYLLAMLALILVLGTLSNRQQAALQAPELTDQQIADDIRRPSPAVITNERQAIEHLQLAREGFSAHGAADLLYRTYTHYRQSLAYSGKTVFDEGLDQRQYLEVEDRLIREVTERYRQAYQKLRSGQYREAEESLRDLQQFYNDPSSAVFRNVQQQREIASQKFKKKKG